MKNKGNFAESAYALFIGVFGLVILGIIVLSVYQVGVSLDCKDTTVRVDEKWVKQYDKASVYLISDNLSGEVFGVQDSFWKGKFDASDRYAKLRPNQAYNVTVCGQRVQYLSWYRNIIEVRP